MQNAPAMLAQKMMSRQAPYGPVGMVSQNMSGNKKSSGGGGGRSLIALAFDTTTATSGLTFADSNTTVTNTTGGNIASAKGTAATIPSTTNYWYWEFTVGSTNSMYLGVGLPSFVCNATNRVGVVANSVAYFPTTGAVYALGTVQTTVATATTGDVIGFKLEVFAASSALTILKNGTVILNQYTTTTWLPDYSTAWTPIWSANQTSAKATISNNIYSYAGFIPIGGYATTVVASASVPAVADGAYDVYTFNATGTFTVGSTGAVRALVIAGGGGSSTSESGAGGAGGYLEKGVVTIPQTYAITVGGGGSSVISQGANCGSNSVFSTLTAIGGGSGEIGGSGAGSVGGSGGGGTGAVGAPSPGGAGTSGQGFAGGTGQVVSSYSGGGGGGATSSGGSGNGAGVAGNGGTGGTSSITGISVERAGGGGGRGFVTMGTATGGGGTNTTAATINTGGGGGGGYSAPNGGSGVVIIRVRARA